MPIARVASLYLIALISIAFAGSVPRALGQGGGAQPMAATSAAGCVPPAPAAEALAAARRQADEVRSADGASSPAYAQASQGLGRQLFALGSELKTRGCFQEAASALEEMHALLVAQLPPTHPVLAQVRTELAGLKADLGQYAEAEALYLQARAAVADVPAPPARALAARIENDLAELHLRRNAFDKAGQGFARALALHEAMQAGDGVEAAKNLNNLAEVHARLGHFDKAEPLFARALRILEARLGPQHADVATLINNMASLERNQGRYAKAEPLYRRALDIRKARLEPGHPDVAQSYNNLGWLYQNLGERAQEAGRAEEAKGHFATAEAQFREALARLEQALGSSHARVGMIRNNLAVVHFDQQRYADAATLFEQAVAIRAARLGAQHADVAQSKHRLARVLQAQGRLDEAHALHAEALALRQAAFGAEHPDIVQSRSDLAVVSGRLGRWSEAARHVREASDIVVARARRGVRIGAFGADERGRQELALRREVFHRHVQTLWSLGGDEVGRNGLRNEAFRSAQRAGQTAAEAALVQMAARQARGAGPLATLVRERQDLVREWQALEDQLHAAIAGPAERRDAAREQAIEARKGMLDARRGMIDLQLAREFPEFAEIADPEPLTVRQVRGLLGAEEALVLFQTTDAETFVFVVTGSGQLWHRAPLGTAALGREVAALRCGLDETAWHGDGAARCLALLGLASDKVPTAGSSALPFDLQRAHRLWSALLAPAQGLLAGKQLLLVPSSALSELPLHVLVTSPPRAGDLRAARWLARDHATTVLPSIAALQAMRRTGPPSPAPKPLIGFGNPLLDGEARDAGRARLARSRTDCRELGAVQTAVLRRGGGPLGAVLEPQQGGLVDLAEIKALPPLPETADELCAVSRDLKADPGDVRLGARASERDIKALSASGALAHYRLVHFATHGLLAGQLTGSAEPGLVLTPPERASEADDGYLTASEVAGLKLNADWVILSACNTAGGSGTGQSGEALSGLARAFFYAGARALLVSHWEVNSAATVSLVTAATGALARSTSSGRAAALRRAMLALIDRGRPHEAHPAYWAPFVVVGEGR